MDSYFNIALWLISILSNTTVTINVTMKNFIVSSILVDDDQDISFFIKYVYVS